MATNITRPIRGLSASAVDTCVKIIRVLSQLISYHMSNRRTTDKIAIEVRKRLMKKTGTACRPGSYVYKSAGHAWRYGRLHDSIRQPINGKKK